MRIRFGKYDRSGPYHWRELSRLRPKRFNAVLDARYRAVADLLRAEPTGRGVDVGCGDGALSARLGRAGHRVLGVEAERSALAWARRMTRGQPALSWIQASAGDLPLRDLSCDWAVLADVIEHVEEPGRLFGEVARILRPGGLAVVTTPRRVPGHAWDTDHHVHEYDGRELEDLLRAHLDNVQVTGCVSMRLFRAYRLNRRWRTPVRIGVNLCAMAGWNPFCRGPAEPPDERYGQLIASGRRPR
jgi:SAM-dependent methyltransferase